MTARETIRAYYDAFNAQDMQAFLALLADDVVHDINQGERQVGKQAFATFMEHMNRCYRETLSDIVIMANEDGTRAAAEFTVNGTYLATDEGLPEARGQDLPAAGRRLLRGEGRKGRARHQLLQPQRLDCSGSGVTAASSRWLSASAERATGSVSVAAFGSWALRSSNVSRSALGTGSRSLRRHSVKTR